MKRRMEPMQAVLCFIANRSFPLNCSSDDLNNFINENEPSESEELFYYYLWTIVAPCLFCAITVIGTIGNLLVIYVILSQAALRNATNILLVSLALADVVFLLLSVPFTAYKYAVFTWPFGDVICMIVQYILLRHCLRHDLHAGRRIGAPIHGRRLLAQYAEVPDATQRGTVGVRDLGGSTHR